jgi:hypothetical protein
VLAAEVDMIFRAGGIAVYDGASAEPVGQFRNDS